MTYRVGHIGCGRMGTHHGEAYHVLLDTKIVCCMDPNEERLNIFCDRFDVPGRYTDLNEMLARESFDIAAAVVPVKFTKSTVLRCVAAGVKGVFAEKPIAATLEEADELVSVCHKAGVKFACGAIWRSHPHAQFLSRQISNGAIGKLQSATIYGMGGEVSGGGCHWLNMARLLVGSEVDWVWGGMESNERAESNEDGGAWGWLHFENGLVCPIIQNGGAKSGVEVVGEDGVVHWSKRACTMMKLDKSGGGRALVPVKLSLPQLDLPEAEPTILGGIRSLIGAIENGDELWCSGDDMRCVLEIAIALRESQRRGYVPVSLPLADRSLRLNPIEERWSGYYAD